MSDITALQNSTIWVINNVGLTSAQVIGSNPSRAWLKFHSPGGVDIYVSPMTGWVNGQSVPFTPNAGALGGTYHIFFGNDRLIEGALAKQAFQAFSTSGSQPLTIEEGFK